MEEYLILKEIVDVTTNNNHCVVLTVKPNMRTELICLGVFNGNEEMFRLTKGSDITCTVFFRGSDRTLSWHWGSSGYTLVSDNLSKMGKMIQKCIEIGFNIRVKEY